MDYAARALGSAGINNMRRKKFIKLLEEYEADSTELELSGLLGKSFGSVIGLWEQLFPSFWPAVSNGAWKAPAHDAFKMSGADLNQQPVQTFSIQGSPANGPVVSTPGRAEIPVNNEILLPFDVAATAEQKDAAIKAVGGKGIETVRPAIEIQGDLNSIQGAPADGPVVSAPGRVEVSVKNEILLQFDVAATAEQKDAAIKAIGGKVIETVRPADEMQGDLKLISVGSGEVSTSCMA